jgi:hypothetical protein
MTSLTWLPEGDEHCKKRAAPAVHVLQLAQLLQTVQPILLPCI